VNSLLEEVKEEDEVIYEIIEGKKGLRAVNVNGHRMNTF
jgi:cold shock CspA family protein